MKNFIASLVVCFLLVSQSANAQVTIIQAPANHQFVDIGYDAVNNDVRIVGHDFNNNEAPTLYELNANQDGFNTQTLANLPGATIQATVTSISSDANRISGFSNGPNTNFDFEGVTWETSSPNTPIGIGFLNTPVSASNTSVSTAAFSDGVVGSSGGATRSIIWDTTNGIQELPGTNNFTTEARGVSSNGEIVAGPSSHENLSGAAYFWARQADNSYNIQRLDDVIEGHITIRAVANDVSPNGNYIIGEILAFSPAGSSVFYPVIWEGSERTLRVLRDSNGNFFQGNAVDVSDEGFTVGHFFNAALTDAFGFIWQPEFGGNIRLFEDWLDEVAPSNTFTAGTFDVNSIASVDERLLFTLLDRNGVYALVDVTLDATVLLGDVDLDGSVNFLDIGPFISVLSSQSFQAEADIDQNRVVNFLDIAPFIGVLSMQ